MQNAELDFEPDVIFDLIERRLARQLAGLSIQGVEFKITYDGHEWGKLELKEPEQPNRRKRGAMKVARYYLHDLAPSHRTFIECEPGEEPWVEAGCKRYALKMWGSKALIHTLRKNGGVEVSRLVAPL